MASWHIIGIGVDSVKIGRLSRSRMSSHILKRLFHPSEIKELEGIEAGQEGEFLASRYAAKEALVKALGSGFRGIYPSEIGVSTNAVGAPSFIFSQELLARGVLDNKRFHLSLTHEGSLALAFVVAEEKSG
ncbi:MAG: holo-ACP synthase [Spirochaetales bacterium]|nr:holo-ACP synthase [Spirochaetales bacterium]